MTFAQDVRFALRTMRKSPGLTAAGVVALALGIGANTAIFTVADAFLFKPVSIPDANGVVTVYETPPNNPDARSNVAPGNYLDWVAQQRSFERLAAFEFMSANITGTGGAERVQAIRVSRDFFPLLRAKPEKGRVFMPGEDQPGRDRVAVLSYGLWQRRFAADPGIIGRTVELDKATYTIVGVMPRRFMFPIASEIWVPLPVDPKIRSVRDAHYWPVVGRIRAGETEAGAAAELNAIQQRLAAIYPDSNRGWGATVRPVREALTGDLTMRYAVLLLVAVMFVLLIACANVASVQFARAAARRKEMALRAAIGASRLRLIRQLTTETLLLSTIGAACGLLIAQWEVGVILYYMPPEIAKFVGGWDLISIDTRAILFTAFAAAAAGLLSGVFPAAQAARTDLSSTLKEGGRGTSESHTHQRFRTALLVGEIALCLVLLVGAGLMVRGVRTLQGGEAAYGPESVLTARIQLPAARYDTPAKMTQGYSRISEALAQIPGASEVSLASNVPFGNSGRYYGFTIEGQQFEPGAVPFAFTQSVSPEFFRLIRIPLRSGRTLAASDDENAPNVVVVSEKLARRFWPGQNPIGRRMRLNYQDPKAESMTVIGVVADIRYRWFEREIPYTVYVPYRQQPFPFTYLALRTNNPLALVSAVRAGVSQVDSELAIYEAKSHEQVIQHSVIGLSYVAVTLTVLGIMALVLACVGVYGVMAYSVTDRTREIGIRLAVGASGSQVLGMVLRRGAWITAAGVAIGLAASAGLARTLASLIWGVDTFDAVTFVGVSLLLAAVALVATYVPARRAARTDPAMSLRWE